MVFRHVRVLLAAACCAVLPAFVLPFAVLKKRWWRSAKAQRPAMAARAFEEEVSSWAEESGLGVVLELEALEGKSCGDWAQFYRLKTSKDGKDPCNFFVKTSPRDVCKMLLGEAQGLEALRCATELLKVPKVLHVGNRRDGSGSFLVLEYLNLGGRRDDFQLGLAMGDLHRAKGPKEFGFVVDNTIGETLQRNPWTEDWVDFFREQRLRFQVDLAEDSYATYLFNAIAPDLHMLFEDIEVRPSLLHGDFWSGNVAVVEDRPAVFDPAAYYGHHEAEWGMSRPGSLSDDFWRGYRQHIVEDPGFEERRPLYRAYHQQ